MHVTCVDLPDSSVFRCESNACSAICRPILIASTCVLMTRCISRPFVAETEEMCKYINKHYEYNGARKMHVWWHIWFSDMELSVSDARSFGWVTLNNDSLTIMHKSSIYQHWFKKLKLPGIWAAGLLAFSELALTGIVLPLLLPGITSLGKEKWQKMRIKPF